MSLQKQPNHDPLGSHEFGPNATGNKEAAAAAEKTKAALDAIVVDEDALLLAERNDVLDHAIERLGQNGKNWVVGDLCQFGESARFESYSGLFENDSDTIGYVLAHLFREEGKRFCAIGALSAELGPHSYEAVNAAVSAVADVVLSDVTASGRLAANEPRNSYGFSDGRPVYRFNDSRTAHEVIEAFRAAKSQPLRRT